MFKKLLLLSLFWVGLINLSFAAESNYVKLHVFDAGTNGPVTVNTTKINVFIDLIDMGDYAKSINTPISSLAIKNTAFHVNDFENNTGNMVQINAGEFGPNGVYLSNFDGNASYYLGEYSISPAYTRNFKGGFIVNFYLTSVANQDFLTASKVVTYYPNGD